MLKEECKRDGLDDDSDDDDVGTVKSSKRKRSIESDSEEESDSEGESDESDGSDESDEENDDGDGDEKDHSDAPDSDEEEGSDEEDDEEEDEDEESEETDSEEDDTDDETQPTTTQHKRLITNIESGSESDDSTAMESSGDPCPICLGHMKGDIGSPETCDHSFCLECILEWSKKNNSCPQDRKTFVLVFVRHQIGGPVVRRVPVAESKPDDIPDEVEEDQTFCEVCRRRDREDRLLLCDGCDLGYHMECLAPPLEQVPINEWFCPDCQAVNSTVSSAEVEIEDGKLHDLIDDGAPSSSLPTLHPTRNSNQAVEQPRRVRILPRTSASERVRAVISRSRNAVIKRSRKERARPTATQEQERHYESAIDAVAVVGGSISLSWQPLSSKSKPRRSTKAPKRKKRKVTRKRKIKRKKVAPKKRKVSKAGKSRGSKKRKIGKTTRRKRKIKRKRKVSKKVKIPKPAMTPKSRIAEVLGIHPCKPWQLTPTMQPPNSKEQFSGRRDNAALPNLSLLGVNAEVGISMVADEYGDAILAAGVRSSSVTSSQAIARRKALSVRARMSHISIPSQAIARRKALSVRASMSHTSIRIRVAHKPRPIENTPSAVPYDLLGSILENQTRLMNTKFSSNSKNSF